MSDRRNGFTVCARWWTQLRKSDGRHHYNDDEHEPERRLVEPEKGVDKQHNRRTEVRATDRPNACSEGSFAHSALPEEHRGYQQEDPEDGSDCRAEGESWPEQAVEEQHESEHQGAERVGVEKSAHRHESGAERDLTGDQADGRADDRSPDDIGRVMDLDVDATGTDDARQHPVDRRPRGSAVRHQ